MLNNYKSLKDFFKERLKRSCENDNENEIPLKTQEKKLSTSKNQFDLINAQHFDVKL